MGNLLTGKAFKRLSNEELRHIVGGEEFISIKDTFIDTKLPDLAMCRNKKCKTRSDCGSGICASTTCNGRTEYHCI